MERAETGVISVEGVPTMTWTGEIQRLLKATATQQQQLQQQRPQGVEIATTTSTINNTTANLRGPANGPQEAGISPGGALMQQRITAVASGRMTAKHRAAMLLGLERAGALTVLMVLTVLTVLMVITTADVTRSPTRRLLRTMASARSRHRPKRLLQGLQ